MLISADLKKSLFLARKVVFLRDWDITKLFSIFILVFMFLIFQSSPSFAGGGNSAGGMPTGSDDFEFYHEGGGNSGGGMPRGDDPDPDHSISNNPDSNELDDFNQSGNSNAGEGNDPVFVLDGGVLSCAQFGLARELEVTCMNWDGCTQGEMLENCLSR